MRIPPGARDLAVAVMVVVSIARFAPDAFVWPIAIALLAGTAVASLQVIAGADPAVESAGVPIEAVMLPALASVAGLGALRVVPIGIVLVAAVVIAGSLVALALTTEIRVAQASGPPSSADRTVILVQLLVAGFLAFVGVAAIVPGGLPDAATGTPPETRATDQLALIALALADGVIGFLIAYRTAALRSSNLRDVAWFALTGAAVMAIGALALRAIEIPKLLGPALLILVFFLWDAIHGGTPYRRRDPRRVWETVFLAALAIAVVGWSLGVRA